MKIKDILSFSLCLWVGVQLTTAQVAINNDGADPDASAMLDVAATGKGMLIPRLTAAQRDAIANPADGLMIYNRETAAFEYFDGSAWTEIGSSAELPSSLTDITSISSPIPSEGPETLDASNTTQNGFVSADGGLWQSFVAQHSGPLSSVRIWTTSFATVTVNQFRILTSPEPNNPYSGTVLYTQSGFTVPGNGWVTIPLSPEIGVVAGQRYFIEFDAVTSWRKQSTDVYTDGRASTSATEDFAFEVFVRQPIQALSVDSITGTISLGDGIQVVGLGDGQMSLNAATGALHASATTIPQRGSEFAGLNSITFGLNSLASGDGAFAIGEEVIASGRSSMTMGRYSEAQGITSMAIGDQAFATAQSSVAIGDQVRAGDWAAMGAAGAGLATGAVAIGQNTESRAPGAFAVGYNTIAEGQQSFAYGNQSLTTGEFSIAMGQKAEALADRGVAIGDRIKALGDNSLALGVRNNAQSWAEVVVGAYTPDYVPSSTTEWAATDRLFVIGNGPDSNNRSTALIVHKNGDTTLSGALTLTDGTSLYTLPNSDGNAGQFLVTDGAGLLTWSDFSAAEADGDSTNELQTLTQVDDTVTLSNGGGSFSVNDADADPSNEIQTLSQTGTTVTLSNGGGSIDVADGDSDATNELQDLGNSASGTNRTITISNGTGTTIDVADNDSDPANEIQTLTQVDDTVTLSNGGGSFSVNDADADPANEIQTLSQSGTTVTLSNGGGSIDVADGDSDATNEIQNLSRSGTTVTLSDGGGSIDVADGDSDATNEIQTLTQVDDTVTLSNGGGSFSITDADSDPANEIQTLSRSGTTVTLSNGGGSIDVADGDSDATNEIQNLGSSGSGTFRTITITGGTSTTINVADNDNSSGNELQNLSSTANGTDRTIGISNGSGTTISVADNDNDPTNELDSKWTAGSGVIYHNDGNVGIGTNDPSQKLDINGQIRLRGGSPGAGKVLKSSDNNGTAVWSDFAPVDFGNNFSSTEASSGGSSAWTAQPVGPTANLQSIPNGAVVLVMVSFRCSLKGNGSGSDDFEFRVKIDNGSSQTQTMTSESTGRIETIDQHRDHWQLMSFQRVMTINFTGTNNIRCYLSINGSAADDPLYVDEVNVVALRLQ